MEHSPGPALPSYPVRAPSYSIGVQPTRGFAVAATAGLGACILVDADATVSQLQRIDLIDTLQRHSGNVDISTLQASDHTVAVLGWLQIAANLAAAVTFIAWLFRARRNAEIIEDHPQTWNKPWLIFGWIIPIGSLWIPHQIVGDIWESSTPREPARSAARATWPVHLWWVLFLLTTIGGRIVGFLLGGSTLAALRTQAVGITILSPIGIVAAGLAIWIVWRISRFQAEHGLRIQRAIEGGPGVPEGLPPLG